MVGVVQLLDRPGHVQKGIPRQARHIDGLVFRVQRHQKVGITAAVFIIQPAQEDGKEMLLSLHARRHNPLSWEAAGSPP